MKRIWYKPQAQARERLRAPNVQSQRNVTKELGSKRQLSLYKIKTTQSVKNKHISILKNGIAFLGTCNQRQRVFSVDLHLHFRFNAILKNTQKALGTNDRIFGVSFR